MRDTRFDERAQVDVPDRKASELNAQDTILGGGRDADRVAGEGFTHAERVLRFDLLRGKGPFAADVAARQWLVA